MSMRPQLQDIQKRIIDLAVDGAVMYGGDKGADWIRMQFYTSLEKSLKQYTKGAIKVALSLVDLVFPQVRKIPYVGDGLGLIGRDGVKEIIAGFVDKPPYCVAEDSNTIHCYNFEDLTTLSVAIDGSELTKDTDYTVSGTADDFTIALSTALSSGEHDLRVADSKVAFYGKIKV